MAAANHPTDEETIASQHSTPENATAISGERLAVKGADPTIGSEPAVIKRTMDFTAVFRTVPEGYIAYVVELPGAHCTARTLDEARVALRLEAERALAANRKQTQWEARGSETVRERLTIVV